MEEVSNRQTLVKLRQPLHRAFQFALAAEDEGQQEGVSDGVVEQYPELLEQFQTVSEQLPLIEDEHTALTLLIHLHQGLPQLQQVLDLLAPRFSESQLSEDLPEHLMGSQGRVIDEYDPVFISLGSKQILLKPAQHTRLPVSRILAHHECAALVAGDRVLQTQHAFTMLLGEIEHVGIRCKRKRGSIEAPEVEVALILVCGHGQCPVEPKPPAPRLVSGSCGISSMIALQTGLMTIWAIRIPSSMVNDSVLWFIRITFTSPR